MEFKSKYLRYNLTNGDVCVCVLEDGVNWNATGVCLGIYYDGDFYDILVKEDDSMPHDAWKLSYDDEEGGDNCFVKEFSFTGKNVENLER